MRLDNTLATHSLQWAFAHFYVLMRPSEAPAFRRFINTFVGGENDLFHNHKSKHEYHYRYPLIQYKAIGDQAALMGVSMQGVSALRQLLSQPAFRSRCESWIGQPFAMTEERTEVLCLYDSPHQQYEISQYLALNQENAKAWHAAPGMAARVQLLEKCLTAHILKFASSVQWLLPPRSLQVELLDYQYDRLKVHDTTFLSFELHFRTNITLPPHIGLGKSVSQGCGICRPL